jgi:hypothetical protein
MAVYVNKNDQRSGPYEDHVVIDQLRSGMLSPDDVAIRHGDSAWQRLGDMFPDAMRLPEPPRQTQATDRSPVVTMEPATRGGCRRILGWTMVVFGLLLTIGGAGSAAFNRTIDHILCQNADRHEREVNEAKREMDSAKDPVRAAEGLKKMNDGLKKIKISTEGCGDMIDYYRWWFFALLGVGGLGLVIAIAGFFVRRV